MTTAVSKFSHLPTRKSPPHLLCTYGARAFSPELRALSTRSKHLLLGGEGGSEDQDDGGDEQEGASGAGVAAKVVLGSQDLGELVQQGGGLLGHDLRGRHGQRRGARHGWGERVGVVVGVVVVVGRGRGETRAAAGAASATRCAGAGGSLYLPRPMGARTNADATDRKARRTATKRCIFGADWASSGQKIAMQVGRRTAQLRARPEHFLVLSAEETTGAGIQRLVGKG